LKKGNNNENVMRERDEEKEERVEERLTSGARKGVEFARGDDMRKVRKCIFFFNSN